MHSKVARVAVAERPHREPASASAPTTAVNSPNDYISEWSKYQYSRRIASHHGYFRLRNPCSPVTAFTVYYSVPIGFIYCVSLHKIFILEECERSSAARSAWSPASGKYLSDPQVTMVEVHGVAKRIR